MCSSMEGREQGVRGALEAYLEDPSGLSDPELERGFSELEQIGKAVEAKKLRWLAELDRRAAFRRDGYLSAPAWLTDRFHLSRWQAKEEVRTAHALEAMPEVRGALAEGEVSSSAVRVLAGAWESHPEAFEGSERALLQAARGGPVGELRRVVAEWSRAQEADGGLGEAERAHERRCLDLCPTASGMVGVRGELDPEGGEQVMTALQAIVDRDARSGGPDLRTPAQRRADALAELARRYLDSSERPAVAGERPHLTLTVDLQVLRRLKEGMGELDHAGPVHPEAARRVGCNASVRRVVLGPRAVPLDVGRRTPVVPAGVRRAVVVRDRACRFPGCDRPHAWCDAHHVRHWSDGGPTALGNLVLLCRPHHRLVHEGGFRVEVVEGRPEFRRFDGSVIGQNRAPP